MEKIIFLSLILLGVLILNNEQSIVSNIREFFYNIFNKLSPVKRERVLIQPILENNFVAPHYVNFNEIDNTVQFNEFTVTNEIKDEIKELMKPYIQKLADYTSHNIQILRIANVYINYDRNLNKQYRLDLYLHDFTRWEKAQRIFVDIIVYKSSSNYLNFIKMAQSEVLYATPQAQIEQKIRKIPISTRINTKHGYSNNLKNTKPNSDPLSPFFDVSDNDNNSLSTKFTKYVLPEVEIQKQTVSPSPWPCAEQSNFWNCNGVLQNQPSSNKNCKGVNSAFEDRPWLPNKFP